MTLCLLLTVGPSTFEPFLNSLQTPGLLCLAAPTSRAPFAATFGVVQLELEGDPNCDYTAKINIAGSEYNVIIDTGSAHFAVASNACLDCIIPRLDRYKSNDEEEIPVTVDTESIGGSSVRGSTLDPSDGLPLNLVKHHPKNSIVETTAATTITMDPSVTVPSRSSSRTPFNDEMRKALLDLKTWLRSMTWSRLDADKEHTHAIPEPRPTTVSSVIAEANHNQQREHGHRSERRLAVAPAETLYPLSVESIDGGEPVRVSYGIKTHSVGWSGVMTSDSITMGMARVTPGNADNAVAQSLSGKPRVALGSLVDQVHVKGLAEKKANVEFAAITENSGFFSQECGAQHGIWGLGYSSLSMDQKPTLFDTLSSSMEIPNGFALQLCGRASNTTKTGNMFLGGYSTRHLEEPMQFVPLIKKDWYQVRLDGFRVMGEPVLGMQNLNVPKTIVDSGTTNILMSHYNLQYLIRSLAQSTIVRWSDLIPGQDIYNFWFHNAVLRLPRSSFEVDTAARVLEVVISGVPIPIYTSSILKIRTVPAGQAPDGYVDFWWHGFASSTPPDAIEEEAASGGAVVPGSVGTILGETLFAGKVVYFERGDDGAQPGDPNFGRIGFARSKNCFAPADHTSIDVLANSGMTVGGVDADGPKPVRVVDTSEASAAKAAGETSSGHATAVKDSSGTVVRPTTNGGASRNTRYQAQPFSEPVRLIGVLIALVASVV